MRGRSLLSRQLLTPLKHHFNIISRHPPMLPELNYLQVSRFQCCSRRGNFLSLDRSLTVWFEPQTLSLPFFGRRSFLFFYQWLRDAGHRWFILRLESNLSVQRKQFSLRFHFALTCDEINFIATHCGFLSAKPNISSL